MMTSLLASVIAYISTNIDDIFVLMLLFAQAEGRESIKNISAGQCFGIGALVAVSILGAFGVQCMPKRYIALLGLIPIALGIREYLEYKGAKQEKELEEAEKKRELEEKGKIGTTEGSRDTKMISVMLLAIANGADNIGVYIIVENILG